MEKPKPRVHNHRTAIALPCALAGVLAAAGHAAASDTGTFRGLGCSEVGVVVPLPAAQISGHLPPGYTPVSTLGAPALGDLTVAIADCPSLQVDGVTVGRAAISDVGTLVASPDGSAGAHYYSFWELGTSAPQQEALRRAGIAGEVVDGLHAGVDEATGRGAGEAPWGSDAYAIEATTAAPFTPGPSAQWWHEGSAGRSRIAFTFPRLEMKIGTGTVRAAPGSKLAALLGDTQGIGAGFTVALDLEGRVSSSGIPPAAARDERAQPLRLRVRPVRVVSGRRVRLAFRVTRGGLPVARASVTLAGRSVITDHRGRATMRLRFHRTGNRSARAEARGAPAGRAIIRVLRGSRPR